MNCLVSSSPLILSVFPKTDLSQLVLLIMPPVIFKQRLPGSFLLFLLTVRIGNHNLQECLTHRQLGCRRVKRKHAHGLKYADLAAAAVGTGKADPVSDFPCLLSLDVPGLGHGARVWVGVGRELNA